MSDDDFFRCLLVAIFLIIVAFVGLAKGCSDAPAAVHVLEAEGYTEVHAGGWSAFGCGDDPQCTEFLAKGPAGKMVRGVVGCGWFFKGCTVRITGTER